MELKINVDETMFKDVIEKELQAFSKEELHKIIHEMIAECLRSSDVLKAFFTKPTRINSWNNEIRIEPGDILKDAAKCFDLSDSFKEIQQSMIDEIKNNHRELVEKVMLDMIVSGLSNNYNFVQNMRFEIQKILENKS